MASTVLVQTDRDRCIEKRLNNLENDHLLRENSRVVRSVRAQERRGWLAGCHSE